MSVRDYIIATFIGKLPSTALEVIIGHDIVNYKQNLDRLAIIATMVALIYGYLLWERWKRKIEKKTIVCLLEPLANASGFFCKVSSN